MAWTKFGAAKRQCSTRALSPETCLQRLRAEILHVMDDLVSAAWHLIPDIIGVAGT